MDFCQNAIQLQLALMSDLRNGWMLFAKSLNWLFCVILEEKVCFTFCVIDTSVSYNCIDYLMRILLVALNSKCQLHIVASSYYTLSLYAPSRSSKSSLSGLCGSVGWMYVWYANCIFIVGNETQLFTNIFYTSALHMYEGYDFIVSIRIQPFCWITDRSLLSIYEVIACENPGSSRLCK